MRNFGSKANRFSRTEAENEKNYLAQASSPDQIAVAWSGAKEIVAVSPILNPTTNSYEIDFAKLPTDLNLTAALDQRRKNQSNVPPVSAKTLFLTVVPDFSERTRILALDGNVLSMRDDELTAWLVNAERDMYLGTDNHPIFETALEDTACFITRLPNGRISMTEVPRQSVETVQQKVHSLVGSGVKNLVIETPLRCIARYFLTSQPEGEDILRPEKEREVTAFLVVGGSGFSYGLWSPATGLFTEYAFPAPAEIRTQLSRLRPGQPPTVENPQERQNLEVYVRQAFDQLFLQLSPEKLEQLELSNYAQAVWVTEPGLAQTVDKIATEYSSSTGLEIYEIHVPMPEAVAGGLLLGSFNFGADRVIGADILSPVNMARDILVLADKEEINRQRMEEIVFQKQRSNAVFALWAAPVIMLAVLLGMAVDLVRSQIMTGIRDVRTQARAVELKPAVDRRKSYETNLQWYQEFIKQVSALRRQQPVGTNLLYELNSNYPLNIDPAFYISEMKLANTGGVEIKGLANNKDAVTSFLRSLEFAGGSESGKKLFSNLIYEVREGVDQSNQTGQAKLPTMTGSTLQGANPAPGIIAWSIRGNYLPAVEFAPPDPKKKPDPKKPAAKKTPANANNANSANTKTVN